MGRRYVTADVAGLWVGIGIDRVREVLRGQRITPVPLAPPTVAGLLNLRGEIVVALDLRERLAVERTDAPPTVVVVWADGEVVGLLVDDIGEVVDVDDEAWDCPPRTVDGGVRELLSGACPLPEGLLLTLDVDRVAAGAAVSA